MTRLRILERFGGRVPAIGQWSAAEEAVLTAYQMIRSGEEARRTAAAAG